MTGAAQADGLLDITRRLEAARVPYMVTGSVAGYFHGLNRSTADIDIVIDLDDRDAAGRLLAALADAYFVDPGMLADSVKSGLMFNVMPTTGGGKVDLIPLRRTEYERVKFARRQREQWHGESVWVISAADLVLSKLQWARESRSERQCADIRVIMAARSVDESDQYFWEWVGRLDVAATLDLCRETRYDA